MIKKPFFNLLFLVAIPLLIVSCDPSKKAERNEKESIQTYLGENSNLNFERKSSGLYYLEVQTGHGRTATKSDTAYIYYTGKFLDGTTFDTNIGYGSILIRPVNEGYLIEGFDEGLTYMREGGKAVFLIPSNLGYGSSGMGFPGYTPSLFEVEMVRLKPGPAGPLK